MGIGIGSLFFRYGRDVASPLRISCPASCTAKSRAKRSGDLCRPVLASVCTAVPAFRGASPELNAARSGSVAHVLEVERLKRMVQHELDRSAPSPLLSRIKK
jgi:hypothetical protein